MALSLTVLWSKQELHPSVLENSNTACLSSAPQGLIKIVFMHFPEGREFLFSSHYYLPTLYMKLT